MSGRLADRRHVRWVLVAVSAAVIGVLTLTPSTGTGATTSFFCFGCGAWLQDDFSNLLLFAPLGLACAMAGMRPLQVAAASLAYSLAIEGLQYEAVAGRDSAASDLVTNCLGGLLGALTWRWQLWWPSQCLARRIALPAAFVAGLGLGAAGRWFTPRIAEGPYFPSLDPTTGPYPSPARLITATWNGRTLRCCPDPDWTRMQHELVDGAVEVHVRAELLAAPMTTGRLLTVWDQHSLPVVVVGVDARGAWGAFATAVQKTGARDFAVHAPNGRSWKRGDTVLVSLRGERGKWIIRLEHAGKSAAGVMRQSPVLAAFYFMPGFAKIREPVPWWRWVVIGFPILVVALWSARAQRRLEQWGGAALLIVTALIVGMPWMFPTLLMTSSVGVLAIFALVSVIVTHLAASTSRKASA